MKAPMKTRTQIEKRIAWWTMGAMSSWRVAAQTRLTLTINGAACQRLTIARGRASVELAH